MHSRACGFESHLRYQDKRWKLRDEFSAFFYALKKDAISAITGPILQQIVQNGIKRKGKLHLTCSMREQHDFYYVLYW